jgi:hypothetical protein
VGKTTLFKLSEKLLKKVDAIDNGANEVAKKVALDVVRHLVYNTPVDTSQALSNWQVGIGAPVSTTIKPIVQGVAGSSQAQSASAAIARAELQLSKKRPRQTNFISNHLDYIKDLDDGVLNGKSHQYSKPSGFVQRALIIARKRTEGARIKI